MAAYMLNRILFDLNRRSDRPEVLKNLEAHLQGFALEDKERQALLDRDFKELLALGVLPNLVFKYYLWSGLPPGEYGQRVGGHVVPEHAGPPLVGDEQPQQQLDQGGLAGPVGPDQPGAARLDGDVDTVQGLHGPVALAEAFDLRDQHLVPALPLRPRSGHLLTPAASVWPVHGRGPGDQAIGGM